MQNVCSIGIILPNLAPSQMCYYAVRNVNLLLTHSNQHDVTIFYEELAQASVLLKCATMNISEIWSFHGVLISTTISNTLASIQAINSSKKIFYVWDLEWLRPGMQNYLHNIQAYRSNKVKLVARNKDHAKVIEDYCNRKVDGVVENFQINNFLSI